MTDPESPRDWGNVRYRGGSRRPGLAAGDEAGTRFVIGVVVFLAVALAYPWYEYWVQSRLLAREVQVVGASGGSGGAVVIVRMGEASLDEAAPEICRQAGAWLRTSVQGQRLRVQRHRGNAPALEVGQVGC